MKKKKFLYLLPSSLIDTPGVPSGVPDTDAAVGDLSPIGSFCYVYDRRDYVLTFGITSSSAGENNSATADGFHYFHKDTFSCRKKCLLNRKFHILLSYILFS